MPYGTISDETRKYVEMRASQGNVLDRIDLESEADDAYTLDVVYWGALEESFSVGREYASTVADWICDMLRAESDAGILETRFWSVSLISHMWEDNTECVYEVNGEDY